MDKTTVTIMTKRKGDRTELLHLKKPFARDGKPSLVTTEQVHQVLHGKLKARLMQCSEKHGRHPTAEISSGQ